jgi:hypothetical protein
MSVDATPVIVGDLVTVRAELRNTGTQPQQTNGYGSLAVRCESSILSHSGIWPEEGYPIGQFLEPVVMVPGESRSFSMTFRPEKVPFAGVNCMVGLAFHGDAQNAGPFPGLETDSVAIEIVPAPDGSTTTSTTDTTPTTDTTVP